MGEHHRVDSEGPVAWMAEGADSGIALYSAVIGVNDASAAWGDWECSAFHTLDAAWCADVDVGSTEADRDLEPRGVA